MRNAFLLLIFALVSTATAVMAQEETLTPPRHYYFVDFTCSTQKTPTHDDYFMLTGDKTKSGNLKLEAYQIINGNLAFLINIDNGKFKETDTTTTVEGTTASGAKFHFEYTKKPMPQKDSYTTHKAEFYLINGNQVISMGPLYCLERQNIL